MFTSHENHLNKLQISDSVRNAPERWITQWIFIQNHKWICFIPTFLLFALYKCKRMSNIPQSMAPENKFQLSACEFLGKLTFLKTVCMQLFPAGDFWTSFLNCVRQEQYRSLTWVSQICNTLKFEKQHSYEKSVFQNTPFNKLNQLRTMQAVCTQLYQDKIKKSTFFCKLYSFLKWKGRIPGCNLNPWERGAR